jgi:hypothetical protein
MGGHAGASSDPSMGGGFHVSEIYGTVSLQLLEENDFRPATSLVTARFYDRPPRSVPRLRLEDAEGDCEFLVADIASCLDDCESGFQCVADDECEPYPEVEDVGDLRVTGLNVGEALLESFAPSFFYQSEALPYPPCEPGDAITLKGELFSAEAPCIAPLVVEGVAPRVRRDEVVALQWEVPGDPSLSRIRILLDVSHHGGKKGEIVCDVADSGAFTIPESLVTRLVDLGLAGFPSVILTRRSHSPTDLAGVTFEIVAAVERPVDTGIDSCLSDDDCPEGGSCDVERVTCVP